MIEKYTGVLAAADVFTESTTFWVMESIRLDLGYGSQVHPLMTSLPVRDPGRRPTCSRRRTRHSIVIDYQPSQFAAVRSMDP